MARPVTALAPLKQNEDQIDESGQYKITEDGAVKSIAPQIIQQKVLVRTSHGRNYSSEANGDIQILAREKVIAKWNEAEWPAFHFILDHESGSNPYAINRSSGACGLSQALPCSKLLRVIGSLDNIEGQIDWMINYVAQRYGTPTNAVNFWQSHHWY